MATVGAFEAKTKLSELLDRVQRGEEIVITRHGKPAARLVPAHAASAPNKINLEEVREIAESFKAQVNGQLSSSDINNILYDENGLPK
jgi:prevent-host-death family protein